MEAVGMITWRTSNGDCMPTVVWVRAWVRQRQDAAAVAAVVANRGRGKAAGDGDAGQSASSSSGRARRALNRLRREQRLQRLQRPRPGGRRHGSGSVMALALACASNWLVVVAWPVSNGAAARLSDFVAVDGDGLGTLWRVVRFCCVHAVQCSGCRHQQIRPLPAESWLSSSWTSNAGLGLVMSGPFPGLRGPASVTEPLNVASS